MRKYDEWELWFLVAMVFIGMAVTVSSIAWGVSLLFKHLLA